MKKLLIVLFIVGSSTTVFSQELSYGVRAYFNVSNVDFDPDATFNNEHRNGFAFAGFVDWGFTEKFSLRTEIQWSAEGAKERNLRADYLQLPILARINFTDKLSAGIGPQLNLKIWGDVDGFSTFALSGIGDLEYMITDELFLSARYSYGLTSILDDDLTTAEAFNHVMHFGVGIKL